MNRWDLWLENSDNESRRYLANATTDEREGGGREGPKLLREECETLRRQSYNYD